MSTAYFVCKSIANKLASELTAENKGVKYFHEIYDNVQVKSFLVGEVTSFPMITITPGPEEYEYQPGGVRWTNHTVYVRAYYKDEYDSERQLALLMSDIKRVVDTPERIQYDIELPNGDTQSRSVVVDKLSGLTTDEGVLRPVAIGELSITLKYCEDGRII